MSEAMNALRDRSSSPPCRFAGLVERHQVLLAVLGLPLFVVVMLWLPFGFALTGLIEEWDVLNLFVTTGLFFTANASSPLAAHALRPLTIFPHAVAYWLDPNSFDYWHVLLMAALVFKGAGAGFLTWKATGRVSFAAAASALVIVWPADTMQFSFRGLHINLSLSLLLLAGAAWVAANDCASALRSYALVAVSALLYLAAVMMYEAAFALTLLPLLFLFVRGGLQGAWADFRRHPGVWAVWLCGVATYVLYAAYVLTHGKTYQGGVVGGRAMVAGLIAALPKLFSVGLVRSIAGGWFDALRMVRHELNFLGVLYAGGVVLAGCAAAWGCARLLRRVPRPAPATGGCLSLAVILRLAVAGLLLICMGYAPYLTSPAHMAISQRTFLFATPGAVLIALAMLAILARVGKPLAVLAGFTLVSLGFGMQLFQYHHYNSIAETQRTLLRGMLESMDGDMRQKTLIVRDESNYTGHTWMFLPDGLHNTLNYLTGGSIGNVEAYHLPGKEWTRRDDLARTGECNEDERGWTFRYLPPVSGPGYVAPKSTAPVVVAKDQAYAITIRQDGSAMPSPAQEARRQFLLADKGVEGLRYRGVLLPRPPLFGDGLFRDKRKLPDYRWNFGDWWSMELPIRGSGWREAEWDIHFFHHDALAWKTGRNARLYFEFAPLAADYLLRGSFASLGSEEVKRSLKISINQQPVPITLSDDGHFEAPLPKGILAKGVNCIEVDSITDDKYFGLSVRLDWFETARK